MDSEPGPDWCRGRSKLTTLSQEDARAKEILVKAGIAFDLVDLSKGIRARLGAKRDGITETPTLLDDSRSLKQYVGLKEISEYATEKLAKS